MALMKFCAHQKSCGCKVLVKLEGRCHKIQNHPRGDDFFNFDLFLSIKLEDLRVFLGLFFFRKKFKGVSFVKLKVS